MFAKKGFLGALGLALLAFGMQLPVQAQSIESGIEATADEMALEQSAANRIEESAWSREAEDLVADEMATPLPAAETELAYPATEETEVAQVRRRRTRRTAPSPNFIGIGGDIGTTDDLSFAVISKFSFGRQLGIRPSVLIGEDFAVLAPVTYEFSQFNSDVQGFQVRPYAGAGASYVESDDEDEFGLLLTGGIDVPVSRRFTVNAQANYAGVFTDSENFGVTVGVGYNFGGGGLLR